MIGHLDIGSLTVKTFERIWIKIGKLEVETLYFSWHICHSGTKVKNEEFDIKREPLFYGHIHLARFLFRPSRCFRALS